MVMLYGDARIDDAIDGDVNGHASIDDAIDGDVDGDGSLYADWCGC